jgi:four helix bundle protein
MQPEKRKAKFRFQDLKIWGLAIQLANEFCDLADEMEEKRLFRFAEQLRGAVLSMPNNIAEGSGSSSNKEFRQFLNIAKRSTFENANILFLLNMRGFVGDDKLNGWLNRLDSLCRQIMSFSKTIKCAVPISMLYAPCSMLSMS